MKNKRISIEFNEDWFIQALSKTILEEHFDFQPIRKAPILFPKITGDKETDKKVLEKSKKEWKEFEKNLEETKKRIDKKLKELYKK